MEQLDTVILSQNGLAYDLTVNITQVLQHAAQWEFAVPTNHVLIGHERLPTIVGPTDPDWLDLDRYEVVQTVPVVISVQNIAKDLTAPIMKFVRGLQVSAIHDSFQPRCVSRNDGTLLAQKGCGYPHPQERVALSVHGYSARIRTSSRVVSLYSIPV